MEPARFHVFGAFCLDTANRSLSRDGESVPLQPKAYDVLLMLIVNAGRTVSREELMDAIWGLNVSEGALNYQINQARRALGDDPANPQYIKTFPKVGFRFIGETTVLTAPVDSTRRVNGTQQSESDPRIRQRRLSSENRTEPAPGHLTGLQAYVAGHLLYVLGTSAIYSAYFAIALLVEIAYQFDRYGATGLWVALLISFVIFLSSLAALALGARRAESGGRGGLLLSASIFVLAAAAVLIGACAFLPAQPITQANFQTFTAQAAYVKAFCYIVPLGLIFLVTPFHFMVAMERELQSRDPVLAVNLLTGMKPSAAPGGTVFLRTWFLLFLLVGMMAYSLIGRAHLFDNLKPGPYMSLFQGLIHVRMILYFGLAILCLAWYYRGLNELKRDVLVGGLNPKLN